MSAFDCDRCGRRIPAHDSYVLLRSGEMVCMRHYKLALDAGQIADVLTREQAVEARHASVSRPRGPELRTAHVARGDQ